MSTQTLSVAVPDRLLARIRDRAKKANHTVEAEVVDLISSALGVSNGRPGDMTEAVRRRNPKGRGNAKRPRDKPQEDDELPPDIAEAIAGIDALDEVALRHLANSVLTTKESNRLAALNYKNQAEGLTQAERREQRELLHQYEKAMVVRASAIGELHRRGVDVSVFLGK
jgi:hypothetical protein